MGGGSSTKYVGNNRLNLDDAIMPAVAVLSVDDYEIGELIQIGGMGRVYSGIRKSDRMKIALKFFGYTKRTQTEKEIVREVNLMQSLVGIPGVVQLLGIFYDTEQGLIAGKLVFDRFPVVVMELLSGGDLLENIFDKQAFSEKQLAGVFKGIIVALKEIHQRGFIHRDLKLENLMYANDLIETDVRIIDFGMMVQLPEGRDCYVSEGLQGTPGYLAPESVRNHEYSAASDMWQAGCCLYSILSGGMPFDDDINQVLKGSYNKMSGPGWDNISRHAKNLVANILRKEKTERYGADDILQHPWIESAPSTETMSKEYFTRIKALLLKKKLRKVFLQQNIEESNKQRRMSLRKVLMTPPLNYSIDSDDRLDAVKESEENEIADADIGNLLSDPQFANKLTKLKRLVISKHRQTQPGDNSNGISQVDETVLLDLEANRSAETASSKQAVDSASFNIDLSFQEFLDILKLAGLDNLASLNVFKIFDIDNRGKFYYFAYNYRNNCFLIFSNESAVARSNQRYGIPTYIVGI